MLVKIKLLSLITISILLISCSGYQLSDETIFDETITEEDTEIAHPERDKASLEKEYKRQLNKAYGQGVQDAMDDFFNKKHAPDTYVYQPGILECGIRMPAQEINGMVVPTHETCVVIKPGGYEIQSPSYIDELRI